MIKLAVLISNKGTGSNLQAIIDAIKNKKLNAIIVVVISDTTEALGLKRAKKFKIASEISPNKEDLIKILKKYKPDYVCLAGWKQIVTGEVITKYPNKILNVHPGLIPDKIDGEVKNPDGTKGLWNKGMLTDIAIQNFLDKKATYAGSSIHFLTGEFDFGPVLARAFEKIKKGDSVESLYERLKRKEHEIYIEALSKLSKTTVLVVDGGGRGAALVYKYLQSKFVTEVLAVPGNDLMVGKNVKIFPQVKTTDIEKIIEICKKEKVNLVDVAQDDAVAAGLANALEKEHIKVFGPSKEAGQIEWDKAWSRGFMQKNNIPSPKYIVCKTEKVGKDFIKSQKPTTPWFIKASGLAAGKGAIYAADANGAIKAIEEMKNFGKAGETYLIEECIVGEEFSAFAILNGKDFKVIGYAQDHKRVFNGDEGPNTGGMGCSSQPLLINKKLQLQVEGIIKKTAMGLVKQNRPYKGILYLGGMLCNSKVKIIEFNARWGDPEAQVIIPSIKNDLFRMVNLAISGNINEIEIKRDNYYRIAVAVTSRGYPDDYSAVRGKQIFGIEALRNGQKVQIFGAGVKKENNKYIASGGRLFYIVAAGKTIAHAREIAYNAASSVFIEGNNLHYRTDIGWRDLERFYGKRT